MHVVSHYKLSTLIIYFNSNNLIGYVFSSLIGLFGRVLKIDMWDNKKRLLCLRVYIF